MPACGMCATLCWQCEQRIAQLNAEWERQAERITALEIAFAEAGDDDREVISERLQDAIEAWSQTGEEIDDLEVPPW